MMQCLLSDRTGDFAAIYDEDIELVSVARPPSGSLDAFAEHLFASRQSVQTQWEQAARDPDAPLAALSRSIDADWLGALSEEIALAGDMLSELVGCERIGIRVTTLRRPMCPRFHVDHIPCRMLVTIRGPGTEWIANGDVDQRCWQLATRTRRLSGAAETSGACPRGTGRCSRAAPGTSVSTAWCIDLLMGRVSDCLCRSILFTGPRDGTGRCKSLILHRCWIRLRAGSANRTVSCDEHAANHKVALATLN